MRNGLKQLFGIAALMVAVSGLAGRAEAAAIVSVTPTPIIVEVGDTFTIEVMVDADDPVGGFDLSVSFDDTVIDWQVFSISEAFNNSFGNPFGGISGTGANLLSADLAGDPIGANLAKLPFQLASVSFIASGLGISAINLPFVNLSDESGLGLLDHTALGGVVCVVADKATFDRASCVVPVPEPGLMALLATGLATAAVRRRRSRQS